jgi:hypothetical protein
MGSCEELADDLRACIGLGKVTITKCEQVGTITARVTLTVVAEINGCSHEENHLRALGAPLKHPEARAKG